MTGSIRIAGLICTISSVETMRQSDIAELQDQFPDWVIGSVWASAASKPDIRRLTARKGVILLSAWNKTELAISIRREEDGILPEHSEHPEQDALTWENS